MDAISERSIQDYPNSFSLESTLKITEQMKKSVCKICLNNGAKGTGFFCKIPFPDKYNLLPVLITNNHIIDKSFLDYSKKENINLNINNNEKIIPFDIENRITYNNQEYDITIIEIKENKENKDNIINFLDLDEIIEKEGSDNLYKDQSIYLLHYPLSKEISVSYGIISKESPKNNDTDFVDQNKTEEENLNTKESNTSNVSKNTEINIMEN